MTKKKKACINHDTRACRPRPNIILDPPQMPPPPHPPYRYSPLSWFHLLPWIPIYLLCSYISLFTFIFFLFFWQNILMARMINSTKSMTQIRLTTVAAWSSDSRQSKFFSPFTMPAPANRSHYGLPISMMHLNSWVSVYTLVHKSSSFLK